MSKKKKENGITLIAVVLLVIFVIVVVIWYAKNLKKPEEKIDTNKDDGNKDDPIGNMLLQIKITIVLQMSVLNLYENKLKDIDDWINKLVRRSLTILRWVTFLVVLSSYIGAYMYYPNCQIAAMNKVSQCIGITGALVWFLFFASSHKNDTLIKCYERIEPVLKRVFKKSIFYINLKSKNVDLKYMEQSLLTRTSLEAEMAEIDIKISDHFNKKNSANVKL
jgi:flagellar basal body-associated protein FliL